MSSQTDRYCPNCGQQTLVKLKTVTQAGRERFRCSSCNERTCFPLKYAPPPKVQFLQELKPSRRYVITAAQNATPVHKAGFKALMHYCDFNDAVLVPIGFRYKNPTSTWSKEDRQDEWWAKELLPYLFSGRVTLNDNLMLFGDIKTQPTDATPLVGNEALSGSRSAIFAHAKVALKCVPTPQNKLPKMLWTTGAITIENYTDTTRGKRGEFHHSLGALVVEIQDEKIFHVRQLNMENNGSFMDVAGGVIRHYTAKGVRNAPRAAGLACGDSHVRFHDPGVRAGTYGENGIVAVARPREIVFHDVNDSYARSHHTRRKIFTEMAKRQKNWHIVEAEIEEAAEFMVNVIPKDTRGILVPSNHHDHITKWIEETDWKEDPDNALFYLETALYMGRNARMGPSGAEYPHPFNYWLERKIGKRADVLYLLRDQSHLIKNIEVGFHGDVGFNGSKGSLAQFRRIGAKTIIGHSHTPGILDGAYQVGTSSLLKLEYTSGLSSWFHTHCLIYANGKRTLINVIGGQWRLNDVGGRRSTKRSRGSRSRPRRRAGIRTSLRAAA